MMMAEGDESAMGKQLPMRSATGVIETCWVDVCRLALAVVVALQLRTMFGYRRVIAPSGQDIALDAHEAAQLGFCRARLRGLLRSSEFEMIDRVLGTLEHSGDDCGAKTRKEWLWKRNIEDVRGKGEFFKACDGNHCEILVAVMTLLSKNMKRHIIGGDSCLYFRAFDLIDSKLRETFTLFDDIEENFNFNMPISLAQVNKALIVLFMIMYPLTINHTTGFLMNILMPAAGSLVFLILEYLAIDMEVIFGLGRTHMDVSENLHQLEAEILTILDFSARYHERHTGTMPKVLREFRWVKLPIEYHHNRSGPTDSGLQWGLALTSEAHVVEALYQEISWNTSQAAEWNANCLSSSEAASDRRTLWADGTLYRSQAVTQASCLSTTRRH
jgi:hypothetical protein